METLLCVGGPMAGEFVTVDEGLPVFRVTTELGPLGINDTLGGFQVAEYKRELLHDGQKSQVLPMQHKIFFLPDSDETLLEHLLRAYAN